MWAIAASWQKILWWGHLRRNPSTPRAMRARFKREQVRSKQCAFEVRANWDPGPSLISSQHTQTHTDTHILSFNQHSSVSLLIFIFLISAWYLRCNNLICYLSCTDELSHLLQWSHQDYFFRRILTLYFSVTCDCVCVARKTERRRFHDVFQRRAGWASRELLVLRAMTPVCIVYYLSSSDPVFGTAKQKDKLISTLLLHRIDRKSVV